MLALFARQPQINAPRIEPRIASLACPAMLLVLSFAHSIALANDPIPIEAAFLAEALPVSQDNVSPDNVSQENVSQDHVDFQREIRSILSNRCFACHGPDEAKVEAGLRLDLPASATRALESGSIAIVPGKPEASELLSRITSDDDSIRMPPPSFGEPLSSHEIDTIRRWIAQGAKFAKHWSFIPPKASTPPIPPSEFAHWIRSPIDAFALKEMLNHSLYPSPLADRRTLLRRWSLDLTGLPPTIEEQQRFVEDSLPGAEERAVDRLISSPQYGEHWARKWLDLARYADSAGYADDPARTIWAYRDWVIEALNQDIPFDRFTIEQLAGDLLPNPTRQQRIATAFHRNTLTNNEGGTNDEEFRNVAVVDRVNTTMAVWMGVTMACAQCHNHKYDPISQQEYFQVFAIFNQSEDADRPDESPRFDVFTQQQLNDREAWHAERDQLRSLLESPDPALTAEQASFEESIQTDPQWSIVPVAEVASDSGTVAKIEPNGQVRIPSTAATDNFTLRLPLGSLIESAGPRSGQSVRAFQILTMPQADLPGGGAGMAGGNFVLTKVVADLIPGQSYPPTQARYLRIELHGDGRILSLAEVEAFNDTTNLSLNGKATQSSVDYGGEASRAIDGNTDGNYANQSTTHTAQSSNPWWELDFGSNQAISRIAIHNRSDGNIHTRLNGAQITLLDENRQEVWKHTIETATKEPMPIALVPNIPIPIESAVADYSQPDFPPANVLDNDPKSGWAVGGSIAQSHRLQLLLPSDASQKLSTPSAEHWQLRVRLEFQSPHANHLLSSFQLQVSTSDNALVVLKIPPEMLKLARKKPIDRTQDEANRLASYFKSTWAPSMATTRSRLAQLETQLQSLQPATTVPIMRDLAKEKQRESFVHVRGNYRSRGETVQPGLPSAFHALEPSSQPPTTNTLDRLALARWITQPDNPLTARVTVNRLWETLFGLGLVRTTEEFGSQGDLPTHPELLDWLATEYLRRGWNTKSLLREVVLSATYMQQSTVSAEKLERDSENVFLSRGPRYRLSAEQVRDQALALGGLLSHRMYGDPVKPRQPKMGLSAAFGSGTDWETSSGENRYRRGLYTTWRRSNPYPSMATFDAPNREVCTLKHDRTNTPLQALVTLNDPVFVEAAQGLARRILLDEYRDRPLVEQLARAFQLATGRLPENREVQELANLYQACKSQLEKDPQAAMALATDPIGPLPNGADSLELATWTTISNVLLNLDEVLMTR